VSVLNFFYRNGLWVSWPFFGLGLFLLWTFIATATKMGERNRICSLPLVAEQRVDFPGAGKVVLWPEGPRATTRFGGLGFELRGSDGTVLKGQPVLVRNRPSGVAKVKISDRTFDIPHAGGYTLMTPGLAEPRAGHLPVRHPLQIPGGHVHAELFERNGMPDPLGPLRGVETPLEIIDRSFVEFMVYNRVELEDSPYADTFLLIPKDPVGARAEADDVLLKVLADYESREGSTPAAVSLAPGGAALLPTPRPIPGICRT